MAEPKLVFCNNNHIYDAAVDRQCPYCRKIEEEQKKLKGITNCKNLVDNNFRLRSVASESAVNYTIDKLWT